MNSARGGRILPRPAGFVSPLTGEGERAAQIRDEAGEDGDDVVEVGVGRGVPEGEAEAGPAGDGFGADGGEDVAAPLVTQLRATLSPH